MERLVGKVAVITGTAGGQGRAAARLFAAEGASVVGCDLNVEGAAETVRMVEAEGGIMSSTAPLDLGDPRAVTAWIDEAASQFGHIDILYNNASAVRFAKIPETTDEDWRFTTRNELDIIFYACRAVWPHMAEAGKGVIISTASCGGILGYADFPSLAHAATKGGVISMTRALAAEGAEYGIRANCISPGMIYSPATSAFLDQPDVRSSIESVIPWGRIGTCDDVARAALFLVSDESDYLTAVNLPVDGGATAITRTFPVNAGNESWRMGGATQQGATAAS